jgi:NAD(P)-dependent dehydrogenase (short-subunit alcohol dehydrogenase family)
MKTLLSIGAGPGMGLARAGRFAGEGFRIILSARNETKTKELAGQLEAKGHKVGVRTVDAAEPSSIAALVSQVESQFAGIDVLHFNAASLRKATLADQPRETFNYDLAVNIGGAMVAAQAAAPNMIARGSGSILFTGGGFGLQPHLTRRRTRFYHRDSLKHPGRLKASWNAHARVIDAIQSGDELQAQAMMREHILYGGRVFAGMIANLASTESN